MERWLKRKAPDDTTDIGNSHEPRQQETNNVSAPEEINWEEEIQLIQAKGKI